jgi:hypothetical protein
MVAIAFGVCGLAPRLGAAIVLAKLGFSVALGYLHVTEALGGVVVLVLVPAFWC